MSANHSFLAIDVARFLPLDEFYSRMEWLVGEIKSARPAKDYDEVLVAGEPERRAAERRRREGIPIPDGVWRTVAAVAQRLGVALPDARPAPFNP
jgi:LDH2 family malate/lactate/ureidoglycolate dehydrogenase